MRNKKWENFQIRDFKKNFIALIFLLWEIQENKYLKDIKYKYQSVFYINNL